MASVAVLVQHSAIGLDLGRRDRAFAVCIFRQDSAAHMPDLHEDASASGVDGLGNIPPSRGLRIVINARRVAPAAALRINGGGF